MTRQKVEYFHFLAIVLTISIFYDSGVMRVGKASRHPSSLLSDAFVPPDIPPEHNSPITPGYYETSEYLIGSVAVGIIFLESNGSIDLQTENWSSAEESNVTSEIQAGFSWWANQNPSAFLSFKYAINYSVPTSYEPINRPAFPDQELWISEAMSYLGYPGTDYFAQVRDYVNDLREELNTDWAFAIFVVDSSNDDDGRFTDNYFAYAYLGGPFLVLTYDNNNWGIENMDFIAAHELGHIFYATDEYDGVTEYSGYLNVSDVENSGGLMDSSAWFLSEGTKGQVGWRDSDGDGMQDIVDTFPYTKLVLYPSNLTSNATLTYEGFVTEVPYPNSNPYGTGRNVTINTITMVEYSIDSNEWLEASPVDGAFDEAVENFTFTTPPLSSETSTVQVRGINSVGNIEPSNATHTVIVDTAPPVTSLNYSRPNYPTATTTYVSKNTTFTLNASDDISGVANTYYKVDSESWTKYTSPFTLSNLTDGIHTLYFYSIDQLDNKESTQSFNLTLDNTEPVISFVTPSNKSAVGSPDIDVSWTGFDYGSGIAYYEIKIDDKEYGNKGTFTNHTFSNVTEGSHDIYLKAVDKLGNSRESSITIVVDTTPPIISIDFPKNRSGIKSSRIAIAWSGFDELAGIDHYEVRLDNNLWINVATTTTYTFSQLSDGTHIIDIRAIDKAGNSKQTRIVFTVNTSLIGKPGWTDDIIIFSTVSIAVTIILVFLLEKQMKS
jgi:hypothetical protein